MTKAKRVEGGVRYCSTCYARSFKRLMCGGCGMFKKLLASQKESICQQCTASKPCIRCQRTGRPVGKLTAQGPVCNACYKYFVEPSPCEVCGRSSRRLSRMCTADGNKLACPHCLRMNNRSCATCRKHRQCEQTSEGKWQCQACRELGEVICGSCALPMPAGAGQRCEACYWSARCQHISSQLLELLRTKRVRNAFVEFAEWLPKQGSAQRAALKLTKHVQFFELLDALGDEAWTGELLLKSFGTATLRKYELPVRWLKFQAGVVLNAQDKANEADSRRVRKSIVAVPEDTVARKLLDAFKKVLDIRRDSGKLTERSIRLAFQPAIALLEVEDPSWMRAPTQAALDRYLAQKPGQRAAISTFIGFLKSNSRIELLLPAKSVGSNAVTRKKLEKQMALLMSPSIDAARIERNWIPLALRYFHYLSLRDARTIFADAEQKSHAGGLVLSYKGQVYWIPSKPMNPSLA